MVILWPIRSIYNENTKFKIVNILEICYSLKWSCWIDLHKSQDVSFLEAKGCQIFTTDNEIKIEMAQLMDVKVFKDRIRKLDKTANPIERWPRLIIKQKSEKDVRVSLQNSLGRSNLDCGPMWSANCVLSGP